jgi:hypothetical protein
VIGAPPHLDYGQRNPYGVLEKPGRYISRFADLLHKIQACQPDHHIFFFSVNTAMNNGEVVRFEDADLKTYQKAFGVTPRACQACTIMTNIPSPNIVNDFCTDPTKYEVEKTKGIDVEVGKYEMMKGLEVGYVQYAGEEILGYVY